MVYAPDYARQWLAVWNGRDLEQVLALYSETATLHSPYAKLYQKSVKVTGKAALRDLFAEGFRRRPNLNLTLQEAFLGNDAVTVIYEDETKKRVAETLLLDAAGLIGSTIACFHTA